jgi:hypothetical protein
MGKPTGGFMADTSVDWSKYGITPTPNLDLNHDGIVSMEELKNGPVFQQIEKQDQQNLDKAKQDNNYWDILTTPRDRVLADKNQDGKVDYTEYREFTLSGSKQAVAPSKPDLVTPLTMSIGMVCITLVIVALLFTRKRSKP